MSLAGLAVLFVAGLGAGTLSASVGNASLFSYPALLWAGLSPVAANVTNTVALMGAAWGSVPASRRELTGEGPTLRRWLPFAAIGAAIGATLLLVLPERSFATFIPFLIAGSSVLVLLAPRIRARAARRAPTHPGRGRHIPVLVGLISVYSGYFGAAAATMLLAVLLSSTDRSLPVANALKNILLGLANLIGVIIFVVFAPVQWVAVPPLLIGCLIGGAFGPLLVRKIPAAVLRPIIAAGGLALAIRLWLG